MSPTTPLCPLPAWTQNLLCHSPAASRDQGSVPSSSHTNQQLLCPWDSPLKPVTNSGTSDTLGQGDSSFLDLMGRAAEKSIWVFWLLWLGGHRVTPGWSQIGGATTPSADFTPGVLNEAPFLAWLCWRRLCGEQLLQDGLGRAGNPQGLWFFLPSLSVWVESHVSSSMSVVLIPDLLVTFFCSPNWCLTMSDLGGLGRGGSAAKAVIWVEAQGTEPGSARNVRLWLLRVCP